MTVKTLADVRALMRHLPEDRRSRSTGVTLRTCRPGGSRAPTQRTSQQRCAWCCQWRASSAGRSSGGSFDLLGSAGFGLSFFLGQQGMQRIAATARELAGDLITRP
jgi:hypothetical protein